MKESGPDGTTARGEKRETGRARRGRLLAGTALDGLPNAGD